MRVAEYLSYVVTTVVGAKSGVFGSRTWLAEFFFKKGRDCAAKWADMLGIKGMGGDASHGAIGS
jgi:hypothetical protein